MRCDEWNEIDYTTHDLYTIRITNVFCGAMRGAFAGGIQIRMIRWGWLMRTSLHILPVLSVCVLVGIHEGGGSVRSWTFFVQLRNRTTRYHFMYRCHYATTTTNLFFVGNCLYYCRCFHCCAHRTREMRCAHSGNDSSTRLDGKHPQSPHFSFRTVLTAATTLCTCGRAAASSVAAYGIGTSAPATREVPR